MINTIHIRLIKQKYRDIGSKFFQFITYTDYSDIDRLDFILSKYGDKFVTECLCNNTLVRTIYDRHYTC